MIPANTQSFEMEHYLFKSNPQAFDQDTLLLSTWRSICFCLFLSLFCTSSTLLGQNLVPNSGFEEYGYQPAFMSKSGKDFRRASKYWIVPNEASTDLINPRFNSKNLSTIPPHSGDNMAGNH